VRLLNFPVVMMGTEYWRPLHDLLARMAAEGTIDPNDLDLLLFTDSPEEAMAHIRKHGIERFGLARRRGPARSRLLGE
jgi:predicted Rossmann-fold nucleotide-binding protein